MIFVFFLLLTKRKKIWANQIVDFVILVVVGLRGI